MYFLHYPRVVIISFTRVYVSLHFFSYSFGKLVFRLPVFSVFSVCSLF